jgi:RHS repeat-associated protein
VTIEGEAGCDTAADPLCATDLLSQTVYSDSRLHMTISPLGHRDVVAMRDEWGRTLVRERYSSDDPTNAKERLEMILDPDTGAVLEQNQLTPDGSGGWTVTGASVRVNDSLGRLYQTVSPVDGGVGEYTYDPGGNTISYKDQNHSEPNVLYEYDNLGRMISVKQLSTPPDDNPYIETSYGYDRRGNLTSVTDANGNVTTYDVDDFGQTYRIISPVTGATEMVYNEAGQMTQRTDSGGVGGVTEVRSYDVAGRLTDVVYNDGSAPTQSVTYGYQNGQLALAETLENGVVMTRETWTYDRRRMMLQSQRELPDLGRSETIRYGYNEDGSLIEQGIGQYTVTYVPDHTGRPTAITVDVSGTEVQIADDISYLAYGPVSSMNRGASGAITEVYGHDLSHRLTSQLVSTTGSLIDRSYTYDLAGNLNRIDDNLHPERGRYFGYDDLGRLRSQTRHQPTSVLSFSYDAIGNRIMMSDIEYGADATSVSITEYVHQGGGTALLQQVSHLQNGVLQQEYGITHDAVGNVTNDGLSIYTYDLHNKMVEQADISEQLQISFRYNATGLRVLATAEAGDHIGWMVDTYLQPDGNPFLEVTLDETLAVVEEKLTVHQGSKLLAIVSGKSEEHVISDHIGYPIATFNDQGDILWHADHQPFGGTGEVYAGTAVSDPLRRYPGQWKPNASVFDAPTNLFYNGHRWYRPEWGRYTQADPLGLKADLHLFRYAWNNPVMNTDPSGLLTCVIFRVGEVISHAGIWSDDCGGFVYDPGGGFNPNLDRGSNGIVYRADLCEYLESISINWTTETISVCFDTTECEACDILANAEEQGDVSGGLCSAASSSCLVDALEGYSPPRLAIIPRFFRKVLLENDSSFHFPLDKGEKPPFCK